MTENAEHRFDDFSSSTPNHEPQKERATFGSSFLLADAPASSAENVKHVQASSLEVNEAGRAQPSESRREKPQCRGDRTDTTDTTDTGETASTTDAAARHRRVLAQPMKPHAWVKARGPDEIAQDSLHQDEAPYDLEEEDKAPVNEQSSLQAPEAFSMRGLLRRWFVQYNPVFTLSAMCVIAGVYLLQTALGNKATLALTVVIELYQTAVIGLAVLLYRRLCEQRAGVILGLIAIVFLIDPTMQVSALVASDASWWLPLWALLWAGKWRALAWGFCLKLNRAAQIAPPLGAAAVALLMTSRVHIESSRGFVAMMVIIVYGLFAGLTLHPPRVNSTRSHTALGSLMLPRCLRATAIILGAGFLLQAFNAGFALGARAMVPMLGALVLVIARHARREFAAWALVVLGSILLGTLFHRMGRGMLGPEAIALLLFPLAHCFALVRFGPRGWVAGVFVLCTTVYWAERAASIPGDTIPVTMQALGSIALLLLVVKRRAWSAIAALCWLNLEVITDALSLLKHVPVDAIPLGVWGGLIVSAGFVFLPLGAWAQRRLGRHLEQSPDEALAPARQQPIAPMTSAAVSGYATASMWMRNRSQPPDLSLQGPRRAP